MDKHMDRKPGQPNRGEASMNPQMQASIAIYAAKHWRQWGFHAVRSYLERRGVPLRLAVLARQLEAASHVI